MSKKTNDRDAKFLRLIDDKNEPLPDKAERDALLAHVAGAKFSDQERTLGEWTRIGASYVGLPHPSKPTVNLTLTTSLNCAEWHALKHTGQGEWNPGTTTQEYLDDIRASVLHASALLDVGRQQLSYPGSPTTRTAPRVAVRTDMDKARADVKKAAVLQGRHMLTLYAPDTKRLVSAYQLEAKKAAGTVNAWSNHRSIP